MEETEAIPIEEPKKRGRPPGSKNRPKEDVTEIPVPATEPNKRGRPKKDEEIPPKKRAHANIKHTFSAAHDFGAMSTGVEEFALTDAESTELANVYANFLESRGWLEHTKHLDIAPVIGVTARIERKKFGALANAAKERKPGTEVRKEPPKFKKAPNNNPSTIAPTQMPQDDNLSGPDAELRDILSGQMKP
jgi:hypothetical protein